jgi:uncharacterized membrane protein
VIAARPVRVASLAVAALGVAVSTYLTIAHYSTSKVLVCSSSGTINCERVTTSPQSTFLGIPVALLGLLWFMAMTALCVPRAWSSNLPVQVARLAVAIAGMGFTLWLVYAEMFIIGAICLWCTAAHLLAFILFVITVLTAPAAFAEGRRVDQSW